MFKYGFFTDDEIEETMDASAGYKAGGREFMIGIRFGGIELIKR